MSPNEPDPRIQANPTPGLPLPAGELDQRIQATPPPILAETTAVPPGIRGSDFRVRLRQLFHLHREMSTRKGPPPMWGILQTGSAILGMGMGMAAASAIIGMKANVTLAAMAAVFLILVGGLAPAAILKLVRQSQSLQDQQSLDKRITGIVRDFPEEVHFCGGPRVLNDFVEFEALVQILAAKYPLDAVVQVRTEEPRPLPPVQQTGTPGIEL